MAPNSTIYKAELQVSDMDRQYYAEHNLTLAQHPSETPQRLMARLIAFVLFAAAAANGLIDAEVNANLTAVVVLSMALTPLADRKSVV